MFKGISSFFSNLTVSQKLATGFGVLVFLTLLAGIVSFAADTYKRSVLDEVLAAELHITYAKEIEIATLTARRREKDFLLRWTDEGYETAYTNYITVALESVQVIRDTTAAMRSDSDQEEIVLLDQIEQTMTSYGQNLVLMAETHNERGFQDTGLEGAFRTSARALEEEIGNDPDLLIPLLQMRRAEKDYLLRSDESYLQVNQDYHDALVSAIRRSDQDSADQLVALADAYQYDFGLLAQKDTDIAAVLETLINQGRTAEPLAEQINELAEVRRDNAVAAYQTAENVARVVQIVLVVLSIGTGSALAVLIARQVTGQVSEIDKLFRAVGIGDFDYRAAVLTKDELGRIADGVNAMLQRFVEMLSDADQERTTLQSSIDTLVAEVSELASGNLSIYAEAGADAPTRPVADALNFAVGELRTLVSGVEEATSGVTGASANISEVVAQMTNQAANSATVAEQASQSAKEGSRVVDATISAMERIRENTQESATRMKRLGEASQEISEVVRFIEEIADRTTVLALNASIQAAAAGDAGRGFAVVAEEVQRLAERSTAATRQIENLVKGIQAETNEAVVGIEEATREVVDGSELARVAGIRMGELNALITELATLIERVAQDTSRQTEDSVRVLSSLSTDLEASVAAFRSTNQPKNGSNGKHENGSRSRMLAAQR